MDGNVEEVTSYHTQSTGADFQPYEYKTTSVSLLKFEGGRKDWEGHLLCRLFAALLLSISISSEVKGASLITASIQRKLKAWIRVDGAHLRLSLIDSGDVSDHPYEPQFQAFIDSIGRGESMPLTDFDTAFETHRVVFAADMSAEADGRTVKLSELA